MCFRERDGALRFLLVRTSDGGRWTFPKGGRGPGETLAQSATREAAEEAGAVGTIVGKQLTVYRHAPPRDPAAKDDAVAAFLLEVTGVTPAESGREPTWFTAREARDRLAASRDRGYADELARVLAAAERELLRRSNAPAR